jgi:hypothetical protein
MKEEYKHRQLLIATILAGYIANGRAYEMKDIYEKVEEILGIRK